jgi:hypothetical protein
MNKLEKRWIKFGTLTIFSPKSVIFEIRVHIIFTQKLKILTKNFYTLFSPYSHTTFPPKHSITMSGNSVIVSSVFL